ACQPSHNTSILEVLRPPVESTEDAAAVLGTLGVDRAVVVGVSLGAAYGARLAARHPDLVCGLVLVSPALPLTPPAPERAAIVEKFWAPRPEKPRGWERYNAAYWQDHYADFAEFFFRQCLSEPHSTKPREDAVGWALETGPEVLVAEAEAGAGITPADWAETLSGIEAPTLVIHGTEDRIHPYARGAEAARLTGGTLVTMEGCGHLPNLREPVRFHLELGRFVEAVAA